ncbi:MAG TPA: patatin-like protein [Sphingomonadaceae bacterium]|nr:patatin-like protein [Sphingomonadaceae bacterium]
MREKELRLALVCYGGISLAVYMHGITMELWRLVRASRAFHAGEPPEAGTQGIYHRLLEAIEASADIRLRVLIDIIAGASAGGINGVFLAQAIATGRSLEPLTEMWLTSADADTLTDPDARPFSRATKFWAVPLAWMASGRAGGMVERTVDPQARGEVRAKLSRFVRARWFAPPFSGDGLCRLMLAALDAMAAETAEPPLLPDGQPLDLYVTVTDFLGHPERLAIHSPREVQEIEHRLTLAFSDRGAHPRRLGSDAELTFATRATSSFPGAFPPFTIAELDRVLAEDGRTWPGRDAFLARALPRHSAIGAAESAVLIDGSVLANAPFAPAIDALKNRPARREVDRRFVYIDPKPGRRSIRLVKGEAELPGFFATIFGALSDIPREQPIRDNLEAIEARSERIRRMAAIIRALRPEVEETIEALFGRTLFLDNPTPARLAAWRAKAQAAAARQAGYAYAAYGYLKLATVFEDLVNTLRRTGAGDRHDTAPIRAALRTHAIAAGLGDPGACSATGASDTVILFLRKHDVPFRIRRLRAVLRRIEEIEEASAVPLDGMQAVRDAAYESLSLYLDRQMDDFFGPEVRAAMARVVEDPAAALEAIAAARNLRLVDARADDALASALTALPKPERRTILFAYLGFPFDDIATLPLLQGDSSDEFNPVKVDRISPDDATTIREGGAAATLKGIQFNSFGAFFSRAYRENDYLWGRLHGADRLIDIVISALPEGVTLGPGVVSQLKRDAFRAILDDERERLTTIPDLFDELDREIT